ncbi:protein yippee-like At5g53940 isoform X1 [Arachis ipaensis]|uniref:protein yippee-like At5g53940 isoform X1 n=1 Tax=Arachis ipaensis TaxID=130454 RepID=UPI000A2B7ADE|nr:protein yippee-like At5g53940 isoform X1 [Arachis ipaensis]XP_025682100.1 protein yippee-like At5g53940 isoform X1 [Arachis hypogaea]QHN80986.1 Protein yippee-like [Arachis hypogaea]
MGRVFLLELQGRAYRCRFCDTPLALSDDVLSRSFTCLRGRAYLFSNVVNITLGPQEERMMMSGWHTVEDIFCCCCGQMLGWKYVSFTFAPQLSSSSIRTVVAHDKNQRFKEGKSVLERWRIAHDAGDELNLDARAGSSDSENS